MNNSKHDHQIPKMKKLAEQEYPSCSSCIHFSNELNGIGRCKNRSPAPDLSKYVAEEGYDFRTEVSRYQSGFPQVHKGQVCGQWYFVGLVEVRDGSMKPMGISQKERLWDICIDKYDGEQNENS